MPDHIIRTGSDEPIYDRATYQASYDQADPSRPMRDDREPQDAGETVA
jgi:hypothetical protein